MMPVNHFRYKSLLCFVLLISLNACDRGDEGVRLEGFTMGTTYSIAVSNPQGHDRRELHEAIRKRLDTINQSMSTYIQDSELSTINRSQETDWIRVSEDLYNVISTALEISHLTNGAFDITVGPLVNLWGFGPGSGNNKIPDVEQVQAMLKRTGYDKLKIGLSPPSVKKEEPDLYLDLSAIAKGYAVDQIAGLLESRGITDYLVDIGGEIRTSGNNPDGRVWRIGIEKPLSRARAVQQIVEFRNLALATSGDYRNYFEQDGVRYSHTIDPRTGYPIRHKLVSVSILHESAMTADALATALLVMGPTEALDFASHNELAVYFIIKTDKGFIQQHTRAFDPYLETDSP